MFNLISVKGGFEPIRYFIDCPCDREFDNQEIKRIEIPRELAKYINQLKDENAKLKHRTKVCERCYERECE